MHLQKSKSPCQTSPSMRREWIEIPGSGKSLHAVSRLPPCGGSGLKYPAAQDLYKSTGVSLHAEGVD